MDNVSLGMSASRIFINKVFGWMFLALGISALCAVGFASSPELMAQLAPKIDGKTHLSWLGWLVMLAPLGFVLIMSFGYERLSDLSMTLLFIAFAAINGISFSFVLLAYTTGSIIGCFAGAAVMFGVMAVVGWTTKKDLTSWGNLLFMALIGIIVVLLINMFLQSAMLDYIISIIGVVVFTALTAYDVQKLKNMSYGNDKKASVMGALSLYLDFINLFLFVLRLFGVSSSKD
jgi:hypothetical protein